MVIVMPLVCCLICMGRESWGGQGTRTQLEADFWLCLKAPMKELQGLWKDVVDLGLRSVLL